jgi:hypothetical protein
VEKKCIWVSLVKLYPLLFRVKYCGLCFTRYRADEPNSRLHAELTFLFKLRHNHLNYIKEPPFIVQGETSDLVAIAKDVKMELQRARNEYFKMNDNLINNNVSIMFSRFVSDDSTVILSVCPFCGESGHFDEYDEEEIWASEHFFYIHTLIKFKMVK